MTTQEELRFDADPGYRLIRLGQHDQAVLEVDVTEQQNRQLEALWRLWSRNSRFIPHPDAAKHAEGEVRILGFDWSAEFHRLCPDKQPTMTTRIIPDC